MRRLDFYVFREILGPLALGFSVYTFIMLVRFMFLSAEMIIRRGVPFSVVGELLLLTLPNIVVLTLPMALLFGILTAVGRLSSDSELVAIRASGISLAALYRPILVLSLLLTLFNTGITLYALPWGNANLQRLRLEIFSQSVSRQVEPRIFYDEWSDKVLYVFEVAPEGDRWLGVFLTQGLTTHESEVTVADWGEVKVDESGERVVLELGNATTHKVDLNNPDRYQRQDLKKMEILLEDSYTSSRRARISASKGLRELTLPELLDRLDRPDQDAEQRNLIQVEIHKKFAIPVACLVFGLFALPLGYNNRRGGKASGFALSIGVILVYYVLINNGEEAARFGKMEPWLAMWLPNLSLAAIGLFLLARRNRDKSLLLSRIDRWIREDVSGRLLHFSRRRDASRERRRQAQLRRQSEEGAAVRVRVRTFRPRLRFPNLMDRYVLRLFLTVLALVLVSALSLYVVADLSEKIDEILKNQISRQTVLAYYFYLSFQILYDVAPIVMLVATLLTFSLLSRSNEVTAAKALGLSLFRLSLPVVVAATLISGAAAYFQSEVLPLTNQRAQGLEDRIRGRETTQTMRRTDRWLFGRGGYIYNFLHYDPKTRTLQRLQAFKFNRSQTEARSPGSQKLEIESRLVAAHARYDPDLGDGDGGWRFEDGWVREFGGADGNNHYTPFVGAFEARNFNESPNFFAAELRRPEQMSYFELKSYLEDLRASGQSVPEMEVELYNKVAFPVTSLVMVLVALPFAFRLGRQGTLYGLGLSIVLGMVFFAVLALFRQLGVAGVLPAMVAVWSPGALFAVYAVYLFLGVRT